MAATAKKKTTKNFGQEINQSAHVSAAKDPAPSNQAVHRDVHAGGRPSNGPSFRISLSVPESFKEGIDNAALLHKSNKTAYIVSLIKKDLAENGKKYAELAGILQGSES